MKIHFVASSGFVRSDGAVIDYIVSVLHKNVQLTSDWTKKLLREDRLAREEDPEKIYKDEIKYIKECDGVVAEVSSSSFGVGYQISYALTNRKPTLCLYDRRMGPGTVSKLLTGSSEKILFLSEYDSKYLKSLDKPINDFLKRLNITDFIKFNFIATKEIKSYIEWGSQEKNISQSEFLRSVLEKVIEKDLEYKKVYEQRK